MICFSIQRDELKSKLRTSLDSNTGNLTKEELALIDELAKITPDSEPAKNLGLVKGDFRLLNSTMPGVLFRGCKVSLGRATFNMVREGPGISGVRLCTFIIQGHTWLMMHALELWLTPCIGTSNESKQ